MNVVAASVDSKADAERIVADQKLVYPVGYGLDPDAVASATGAFWDAEDEEPYLHATSYVLNGSEIDVAVYTTGSVGRLSDDDVLRRVRNLST